MESKFDGQVTIRVRFRTRAEYEKFRKYILKTDWSYDLDYPMFEELILKYHNIDDLDAITRRVVGLLQMKFEVYCCRYQLDEHVQQEEQEKAEAEHPMDSDEDDDCLIGEEEDEMKLYGWHIPDRK